MGGDFAFCPGRRDRGNGRSDACAMPSAGVKLRGIGITIAAIIVMPILAWLKRRTARARGSRALAADAVQSATCAYLAALTLAGLAINALWHIHWVDATAALLALPILILEGRRAPRGESCGCC